MKHRKHFPAALATRLSPLLAAALMGFSAVSAHAQLEAVSPADRTVLDAAPAQVRLVFTEPVEVRFGIFKVYPLTLAAVDSEPPSPAGSGPATTNEPAPSSPPPVPTSEREWQHLNALAAELVEQVLTTRGDERARADSGLESGPARTTEVVIYLRERLPAGAYVVMWRVLAIDGHSTEGFITFLVTTEEQDRAE